MSRKFRPYQNILNFPIHTRSLANELSSLLFDENISELSKIQRFGAARSAAYATKNTVIINNLVRYAHELMTNFVVSVKNNSSKALQVAHEFSPDIIVLDLYMPGMIGGEVLASLRDQLSTLKLAAA
ncbi:MAG: CheY-like chemotaxis protein [Halioglobus sp.]